MPAASTPEVATKVNDVSGGAPARGVEHQRSADNMAGAVDKEHVVRCRVKTSVVGSKGLAKVTLKPVGVGDNPVTIKPRTAMGALTADMAAGRIGSGDGGAARCFQGGAEDADAGRERAVGRQHGGTVAAGEVDGAGVGGGDIAVGIEGGDGERGGDAGLGAGWHGDRKVVCRDGSHGDGRAGAGAIVGSGRESLVAGRSQLDSEDADAAGQRGVGGDLRLGIGAGKMDNAGVTRYRCCQPRLVPRQP